jgi:hypothetical protein
MISEHKISDELIVYNAKLNKLVELITEICLLEESSDRAFDRVYRNNMDYLSKSDMAGMLSVAIIGTVFEKILDGQCAKRVSKEDS